MGMLSVKRYDNPQDLQLRLQHSVVKYRDRPVFVGQGLWSNEYGIDQLELDVYDLLDQRWLEDRVHSSDEDLEVKAMPLGYVNLPTEAYFICRQPCRRARQGLSRENCFRYDPTNSGPRNISNMVSVDNSFLKRKEFGMMINGDYPDVHFCLDEVRKSHVKSKAFGRKLLLAEDEIGLIKLHWFTTAIGVWNPKQGKFVIPERFEHYVKILTAFDVPCNVED